MLERCCSIVVPSFYDLLHPKLNRLRVVYSRVCLKMYNTLFNYDTTLFSDSVEVIPNSNDGFDIRVR